MNSGCSSYSCEQLVLKRRELEEVVLFGDGLGRAAAIGARIAGLGVVDVQFVEDAVLAGVGALVDIAVLQASIEQILNHFGMLRAGGALEEVDIQVERLPLLAELVRNEVRELCGDLPAAAAARSIFWPCSSVPVVRYASKPSMRLMRLIASAAMVVYVWPMCGAALT